MEVSRAGADDARIANRLCRASPVGPGADLPSLLALVRCGRIARASGTCNLSPYRNGDSRPGAGCRGIAAATPTLPIAGDPNAKRPETEVHPLTVRQSRRHDPNPPEGARCAGSLRTNLCRVYTEIVRAQSTKDFEVGEFPPPAYRGIRHARHAIGSFFAQASAQNNCRGQSIMLVDCASSTTALARFRVLRRPARPARAARGRLLGWFAFLPAVHSTHRNELGFPRASGRLSGLTSGGLGWRTLSGQPPGSVTGGGVDVEFLRR